MILLALVYPRCLLSLRALKVRDRSQQRYLSAPFQTFDGAFGGGDGVVRGKRGGRWRRRKTVLVSI